MDLQRTTSISGLNNLAPSTCCFTASYILMNHPLKSPFTYPAHPVCRLLTEAPCPRQDFACAPSETPVPVCRRLGTKIVGADRRRKKV